MFHFSEWYVTVVYRPDEATYESWCLNHSKSYTAAQIISVTEYLLMQSIFGEKLSPTLNHIWSLLTILLCVFAVSFFCILHA